MEKMGTHKRDILVERVEEGKEASGDAKALFKEWESDLGQYTNQDLRQVSQDQMNQTKILYLKLILSTMFMKQNVSTQTLISFPKKFN